MALSVVLLLTVAFNFGQLSPLISLEEEEVFKTWISQHNKVYVTKEYHHRLRVFMQNKKFIDHHNAGNKSFTMGLNQFSDMTFKEFQNFYLWSQPQNCSATKGSHISNSSPHPKFIDWRMKGNFVTPVKDQGYCGSCWTFSATGCLESVTAISTGKLPLLSEQQLIDCAKNFKTYGCSGGLPSNAFEFIRYNKGLMSEKDYPYKGHESECKYEPSLAAAFVHKVVNITSYNEEAMVDAVARLNPITCSFHATAEFMHYKDGVYKSTQCKNTVDSVNHAVLAVGYGTEESGTPYWIVKNSWGASWGKDGYFLIERGRNMCGVAACASYPITSV